MSSVVIKAGEARMMARGLCGLDLRDISRQAEAMLSAARAESNRIVTLARKQAESEREAIRQAAHRSGYEAGFAEGRSAGETAAVAEVRARFAEDQGPLVSSLTEMLDSFDSRREQMLLAARRDVVVLAIAIARRIATRLEALGETVTDAAVAACGEALALVRGATEAVVHLHPADRSAVEQFVEELGASMQSSAHIRIVEDASVGRGGTVVETANNSIDATVTSRVERIADELVNDWRARMKALSMKS